MGPSRNQAWDVRADVFIIGSFGIVTQCQAVTCSIRGENANSNMDRDMIAVGDGNPCVSMIRGLADDSEIVAVVPISITGRKTRFANFWH